MRFTLLRSFLFLLMLLTAALSAGCQPTTPPADTIVIGTPIYNFSVPSTLKAWIDLVARVGVTFNYTETGPVGLLEGKRAIIAVASGGTQAGSDIDFATTYLRHVLGFIGITDVELVAADQLSMDEEGSMQRAKSAIEALAA